MSVLRGYARVSTDDQTNDAQLDELKNAGCRVIYQEHGSGASRARPELAKLMREIQPGDVLVVVRLDRLARSVSHLLETIERRVVQGADRRRSTRSGKGDRRGTQAEGELTPLRQKIAKLRKELRLIR